MPPISENIRMKGGAIYFRCKGCGADLAVGPAAGTEHHITPTTFGVVVTPGWSCPDCGLVGKIKKSEVLVVARVSIPPSGSVRAKKLPPGFRDAITIDAPKKDDAPPREIPDEITQDNCPQKNSHGYYARSRQRCPVCNTRFPPKDEDGAVPADELVEEEVEVEPPIVEEEVVEEDE